MSEQNDQSGSYQKREDALIREKMLQQVVLDQKQRIRELEQKLTIQDKGTTSVSYMKHQNELKTKSQQQQQLIVKIEELEGQLSQSKENIIELHLQMEKNNQGNKQQMDFKIREFEQEVFAYRRECEQQVQELEHENNIIQTQLEKARTHTLSMALENYTSEEQYIKQIKDLQGFLVSVEKEYMAEVVHYKRIAEQTRQAYEKVQTLSEEEKRVLKGKLDEIKEVDGKVEKEVLDKFSNLQLEIRELCEQLTKRNQEISDLKSYNIDEIQTVLDEKFQGEHLWLREKNELQNQLKQMQQSQDVKIAACEREVQGTSQLKVIELERHIRENTVLIKEKETLQRALQDMKQLALSREGQLKQEIERYRRQTTTLMDASNNREYILEEEIKKLNFSVFQLHKAFESRENLFMGQSQITRNWDELISNVILRFDSINQDLKQRLENRKGTDMIKDLKNILGKLTERLNELDKQKILNYEKRLSEKKGLNIDRIMDRFVFLCNEYSTKLEILLDRAKALGLQKDENIKITTPRKTITDNEQLKHLVTATQSSLQFELDVTKYEQMLMQKDAEILLAKQNLIQYAQHQKSMEDKMSEKIVSAELDLQKQAIMSIEQQEEMLITRLNIECQKLELQLINQNKEIQQLQTEKSVSLEMRQRYELHFNLELKRIENQLNQKSEDLKRLIVNDQSQPRSVTPTVRKLPSNKNMLNTSLSSTNSLNIKQDSLNNLKHKDLKLQFQVLSETSTELMQVLQDIEKNYLNNQRVSQLISENQVLAARVEEQQQSINTNWKFCRENFIKLESIQSHPTKAFEETFQIFKQEIETLITLRRSVEDAVKNRATFFQKLEENYLALFEFADSGDNQQVQAKIHGSLQVQQHQDAITLLKQEVQMLNESHLKERDCHQKELNIAVENLQSMLSIYEKKVDCSTSEAAALRRLVDENKSNSHISILQYQKDVKALKNEVQSITRIVSEAQQKRLEERKRYLANINQIEQKVVAKQEQSIQILQKKLKVIGLDFDKKARILQQRINLHFHEEVIDTKVDDLKDKQFRQQIISMNQELSILRERDTERDQIISKQFQQLSALLETLQIDIENLHSEKSHLIEQVDHLNQLVGFGSKKPNQNTYSFRV